MELHTESIRFNAIYFLSGWSRASQMTDQFSLLSLFSDSLRLRLNTDLLKLAYSLPSGLCGTSGISTVDLSRDYIRTAAYSSVLKRPPASNKGATEVSR